MKRFLLALAAIAAITVGSSLTSSAMAHGPGHHGHHGGGYCGPSYGGGYGGGGYGGGYGGGGYGGGGYGGGYGRSYSVYRPSYGYDGYGYGYGYPAYGSYGYGNGGVIQIYGQRGGIRLASRRDFGINSTKKTAGSARKYSG